MGKFDKAPVVDFDRLQSIKDNPDILPKEAVKIENEKAEKPPAATRSPEVMPTYRPGSGYKTTNYPGYDGYEVFVVVGTSHTHGYIRYTVSLPDIPSSPPRRQAECPHCKVPFIGAELIYPGRAKAPANTLDITTTKQDFEDSLRWWKCEKVQ